MNRILTSQFSLAQHAYREFNAVVPPETTPEQLTDSAIWENVITQCRAGDEIRVRAEDDSFTARLYVMHVSGTNSIIRILYHAQFEKVEDITVDDPYYVQLCGPLKYCIIKRSTGERVKENIPTQAQAVKELEDYLKALAA